MGNGTRRINSGQAQQLYKRIIANNPQHKHYTIQKKYMVGVIGGEQPDILIYELERSIKPLMRVVDGGELVLLRDFWSFSEGIDVLKNLDRVVALQNNGVNLPVLAEKRERLDKAADALGVRLCPEGRVILGGYQPTYGSPVSTPPSGR